MDTTIQRFTELGLSVYEAKAYVALLKENPLTAYEIAKKSGVPSSKVYEVINKLESRQIAQSIHGERSRMFIPASPEEVIENFRTAMEVSAHEIRREVRSIKVGLDTSYTWHINNYNGLLLKSKRMLSTVREHALLTLWSQEIAILAQSLRDAENRGVQVAIVHYGIPSIKIGQMYVHPVEDTVYAQRGTRGFTLVADSKEVLTANIRGMHAEAIWSMNEGFVMMTEEYVKHDIYVMKIVERFDPLLRKKFGKGYKKLVDVFKDEDCTEDTRSS